jgi:nicotinamide-nucleotide amidase
MRPIHTAELLSVGSELTVGETRDTNSGELAGALTEAGVEVLRITALPDDLAIVTDPFAAALGRADLIVSTGGLGPTPDDLTRESIAAALGEVPTVDPALEAWLRDLFGRRGLPFPNAILKQAWVTASSTPIPNANGTAPGWWSDAPDGRLIVALPGPPREMRPMWTGWVLPRLGARGLGQLTVAVTLRTSGLGESMIAERLGPLLARGTNPTVATYARSDAVDIRISAVPEDGIDAPALVAATETAVLEHIGDHVWGRGDVTWAGAIGERLATRGWRLAIVELGARGAVLNLLGEGLGDRLAFAEALSADHRPAGGGRIDLRALAERVREAGGTEVGLAVRASTRGSDMAVSIAIVDPDGTHAERRLAFLAGPQGRTRAALLAASCFSRGFATDEGVATDAHGPGSTRPVDRRPVPNLSATRRVGRPKRASGGRDDRRPSAGRAGRRCESRRPMRLTVLGTGTARPVADTAASGLLVQSDTTSVLFDIGSGVAGRLETTVGAAGLDGLVVGHMHADHWIDIAPLRYRFPWGEPAPRPLPVHLPPGGKAKLDHLAAVISERDGFFEIAFDVREYATGDTIRIGDLTIRPHPVGHYVPAWSMDITGPDGERIVYAGDMGPSEMVVDLARGADFLILEATLETSAIDDERRGHLTAEEAIDHVVRSGVPRGLLVHYPSERRAAISAICTPTAGLVIPGITGMVVDVRRGSARVAAGAG